MLYQVGDSMELSLGEPEPFLSEIVPDASYIVSGTKGVSMETNATPLNPPLIQRFQWRQSR